MTYKQARHVLFEYFRSNRWQVSEVKKHGAMELLKMPYVTAPSGLKRYYFKTQAMYLVQGQDLSFKNARSTHADIRNIAKNIKAKGGEG